MRRALFHLVGSTAVAQLLLIASTPLLTRSHDKSEFGVFGVATTVALLVSTLLSLKLEYSLHISGAAVQRLYGACIRLILTSLALAAAIAAITVFAGFAELSIAAPIVVFGGGHALFIASVAMLNFRGKLRTIGVLNLLTAALFIAGALGFIPIIGDGLLIWQSTAYATAGVLATIINRHHCDWPSVVETLSMLKTEVDAVRFLVPSQLLVSLSQNIAVVGAAFVFEPATVGLLVIAQRVSRAPIMIVGNGLNETLRSTIPGRRDIRRGFTTVSCIAVVTGLAAIATIQAIPAEWYTRLIGTGWEDIKDYLLPTSVVAGFQLMLTSVTSLLSSYAKRTELLINLSVTLVGIFVLVWASQVEASLQSYLWAYASVVSLVYLSGYVVVKRLVTQITSGNGSDPEAGY